MQQLGSLIKAYETTGCDPAVVERWWEEHRPEASDMPLLAQQIASEFLSRRIGYFVASGLMNQLMPLAGWEQAPQLFWDYYVAFEDAEVAEEPELQARIAVQAVAQRGVA